jgi:hypothetical protein
MGAGNGGLALTLPGGVGRAFFPSCLLLALVVTQGRG